MLLNFLFDKMWVYLPMYILDCRFKENVELNENDVQIQVFTPEVTPWIRRHADTSIYPGSNTLDTTTCRY